MYINDLPDDVVCNIAIYADDTTLYSKCDQAFDLGNNQNCLLNLILIYETVDWGNKWLVDLNPGLNWSHFACLITGAIDVRMDGLILRKKTSFKMLGWLSLLNWIGSRRLSLLLKLPPRKLEPWFVLWSFFILRLLCISINLPYGHAFNTVVMSGLVLLVTT